MRKKLLPPPVSPHSKALAENPKLHFMVTACVQLIRNASNFEVVDAQLKVVLDYAVFYVDTGEANEAIFWEALCQSKYTEEEIETHFLQPLKMSKKSLLTCLRYFLQNEEFSAAFFMRRVTFLLKQVDPAALEKLDENEKAIIFSLLLPKNEISVQTLRNSFLVPLNMKLETLKTCLATFLSNRKYLENDPDKEEDNGPDFIMKRICLFEELLIKEEKEKEEEKGKEEDQKEQLLSRKDLSECLIASDFLIYYAKDTKYGRANHMNALLARYGLATYMPGSLHAACSVNNIELAETLIAQGAAVICRDENDKTPLDICLEAGLGRKELIARLITSHGAAVMQKIPDLLFALGIDAQLKPVFFGTTFDTENPRQHFPFAFLSLKDIIGEPKPFEQYLEERPEVELPHRQHAKATEAEQRENFKKLTNPDRQDLLTMLAKRLEECIILNPNNLEACKQRKRIRFCLPPPHVNDKKKPPFYGLKHMIVEKFPLVRLEKVPQTIFDFEKYDPADRLAVAMALHSRIREENLDILYSNFKPEIKKQIELLNTRLQKLNTLITMLEPYSLEFRKNCNRKLSKGLASGFLFLLALILISGATTMGVEIESGSNYTAHHLRNSSLLVGTFLSSFASLFLIFAGCFALERVASATWPLNANDTKAISAFKFGHREFLAFLESLPQKDFLEGAEFENEILALDQLREINAQTQIQTVQERLIALKTLYQAHITELNAAPASQPPRFIYEELNERNPGEVRVAMENPDEVSVARQIADQRYPNADRSGNQSAVELETEDEAAADFRETDSLLLN